MKKPLILAGSLLLMTNAAFAAGDNGMRGGVADPTPTTGVEPDAPFSEGFDDITMLAGWVMDNNPDVVGATEWFQGNDAVFAAQAGAPTAYIAANFENTGGSLISNWLMTPELDFTVFDTFSFWTRAPTKSTFPDRLQVRVSTNGASSNVGTLPADVGDFTDLLIDINSTLMVGGYPEVWTQFTVTAGDLPTTTGTGRLAFRYFVPIDAGPAGSNSDYIGIDSVEFVEGAPPITSIIEVPAAGPLGLGLLALLLGAAALLVLRRRSAV
jgi:hypothetical protein